MLLGAAEMVALGLLELVLGLRSSGLPAPAHIALSVGVVVVGYGLVGAAVVLAARWVQGLGAPRLGGRPATLALVACVFLLYHVLALQWGRAGSLEGRAVGLLLALCFLTLFFRLATSLLARLRLAARTGLWLGLDGLLIAAAAFLALAGGEPAGGARSTATRTRGPSVLLVSIDTLRADFLGAYGRAEARTPTLDRLAQEGALFEHAIVQAVITGPSHASMLTGLVPAHHGITENLQPLPVSVPSLIEVLGQAGFETGAFVGGGPLRQRGLAIMDRFDTSDEDFGGLGGLPDALLGVGLMRTLACALDALDVEWDPHYRPADRVTEAAVRWLERRERPFFVFVHYFDPHLPYEAPERFLTDEARAYEGPAEGVWNRTSIAGRVAIIETPGAMEQMDRLYDAEIAHVDEQLGRLVEAARASAGADGLIIVVSSDHGESKAEHDLYFSRTLYDDSLRVPLIVVVPGLARSGVRVEQQSCTIDIVPTILDALDLEDRLEVDGISLMPAVRGGSLERPTPAVTGIFPSRFSSWGRLQLSVRDSGWKWIWSEAGWDGRVYQWDAGRRELYDLERDPAEQEDLSRRHPELALELDRQLDAYRDPAAAVEQGRVSELQLRVMRSLGYVE